MPFNFSWLHYNSIWGKIFYHNKQRKKRDEISDDIGDIKFYDLFEEITQWLKSNRAPRKTVQSIKVCASDVPSESGWRSAGQNEDENYVVMTTDKKNSHTKVNSFGNNSDRGKTVI